MNSTSLSFDLSFGDLHDPEDLQILARLGFRTLIDTVDGAGSRIDVPGLRRIALPLAGEPDDEAFGAFVQLMSDPDGRPVFVRGHARVTGALAVVWDAVYQSLLLEDADRLSRALGVGGLSDAARRFIRRRSAAYRRSIAPAESGTDIPLA